MIGLENLTSIAADSCARSIFSTGTLFKGVLHLSWRSGFDSTMTDAEELIEEIEACLNSIQRPIFSAYNCYCKSSRPSLKSRDLSLRCEEELPLSN